MKIKVSEASKAILNYLAAKAEGYNPGVFRGEVVYVKGKHVFPVPDYCGDINLGWPIIVYGRIGLLPSGAAYYERDGGTYYSYGPTPLVAAMRCYVASKYGEEVEIPIDVLEASVED